MAKQTAAQITAVAVTLLRGGLLPSVLPARLMDDFQLSPTEAQRLAGRAIDRWRAETRPRAGSGGKRPGE